MKQTLSLLMLIVLMLSGCVATVPVKGVVDDEAVNRLKTVAPIEEECAPIRSWYHDSNTIKGTPRTMGGFHNGFDMAASIGTPIIAAAPGVVFASRLEAVGGEVIWLRHGFDQYGNQVSSGYAHLSKRIVKSGDFVKRGQLIGYSGWTGTGTGNEGPHLHFGVLMIGQQITENRAEVSSVSPNLFLYPMRVDAMGKSIIPESFPRWDQALDYGDKDWATNNRFYGLTFPVACQ